MRIMMVLAFVISLPMVSVSAQNESPVFIDIDGIAPNNKLTTLTTTVKRERLVTIDFSAIDFTINESLRQNNDTRTKLLLNLFKDVSYTVEVTGVRHSGPSKNVLVISGRIEGMKHGRATLTFNGDVAAGIIQNDSGELFMIRYAGDKIHIIAEIDQSKFPQTGVIATDIDE